jgi:hypothetical protein
LFSSLGRLVIAFPVSNAGVVYKYQEMATVEQLYQSAEKLSAANKSDIAAVS